LGSKFSASNIEGHGLAIRSTRRRGNRR
jgi:hypothetical protein